MTQKQCIDAYKALGEISGREWPLTVAYGLMKLKKALSDPWEFEIEQERRLIDRHQGDVRPDGTVCFPSVEERAAFEAALHELHGMTAQVTFEPVRIGGGDICVSPDALAALDGFVSLNEGGV